MIDTLAIFNELSKALDPSAAKKIAELMGKMYTELSNVVTKQEFKELTDVVKDLGETVKDLSNSINKLTEAQRETEKRLNELAEAQKQSEKKISELAEAQRQTEKRLNELAEAQRQTEQKISELTEAQKKTEQRVSKLEITMQQLAEAQRQTEKRLNELAEAQRQTEQKISELTEAQKKTEQRVSKLEITMQQLAEAQKETEQAIARLTRGLEITREQLGGLSRSVGYALENEAYRNLPSILKSRYNIEVIDRLIRTYISDVEINVFGKAKQDGKEVYLVGEAVLKLDDRSKLKLVWDKVNVVREEFGGEVIPIIVTHFAKPDVLERAKKAGIIVIQSFEWV